MLKTLQKRFIMAAMSAFGLVMALLLIGINIAYSVVTRQSQDRILEGIYEYDRSDVERVKRPINEMPWAGGKKNSELTLRFFVVYCDDSGNTQFFRKEYISSIDEEKAQEYAAAVLQGGRQTGTYEDYRYLVKTKNDSDEAGNGRRRPDDSDLPDPPGAKKNKDQPDTAAQAEGPVQNDTAAAQAGSAEKNSDTPAEASADNTASQTEDAQAEESAQENTITRKTGDGSEVMSSQEGSLEDAVKTIVFLNIREDVKQQHKLFLISVLTGLLSLAAVFVLVVLLSQRAVRPFARNIRLQKQFITDAGHELKTPITSIATSADIAAMLYEGDEWIQNIQKQSERLFKLTNKLVMLSVLDEEAPLPEKVKFSLSEAAWEIAESFSAQCKAKQIAYGIQIEEYLTMTGDRNAIQQMLSLLLDNAVKYTPQEGTIRLKVCREKTKIMIEVFNTCILRDDLDLDRLFDRFYRPDQSRSSETGGSGLGLSIARAIARAEGGELTVSSSDHRSIVFKALFPSA